jgi:hypothetical protein
LNETPKYRLARIETAAARLERAIGRLESALTGRRSPAADPALTAELAAARAENENLRRTTAKVAERLDSMISRIDSALEGPA